MSLLFGDVTVMIHVACIDQTVYTM